VGDAHSGSRGVGNRIGTHFIELAKKDMEPGYSFPDKDLAYIPEEPSILKIIWRLWLGAGFRHD